MANAIVPSFVVQEEGSRKVLVYLNIPELKVKRSFPNVLKFVPTNGQEEVLNFQEQSFTFTINVLKKLYSLSVARLPSEIQPEHCSIKYQRGGCWITLIKTEPTPWMNRICDNLNPGLETQNEDDRYPQPSAPIQDVPPPPPPFSEAPPVPARATKKAPAPPPPKT